jgi:hypothetical protein
MTPRRKILFLMCGLILLYMALVVYFVFPRSGHPEPMLPSWFPYFGLSYIFGSIVLVVFLSRRISRNAAQEASTKAQSDPSLARAWVMYLIAIWSGLFIYGVYGTLKGDFPVERAIPAGAFLLAFIGLFSWLLYRDTQTRKHPTNQK